MYDVGKDGRVWSFNRNRYLKPQRSGRWLVVRVGGERWRVHDLVARQHVPNVEGWTKVVHKDGNPDNNHSHNLKWVEVKTKPKLYNSPRAEYDKIDKGY